MSSLREQREKLDLDSGTKRVVIGNTEYAIQLLPALPAYLLATEIIETVLPALGSAADNGINFQELFPEDRSPFTQIALHLVKGIKELDKVEVIDALLKGATSDGVPMDINKGMKGKVADIAFLVEFALKENFTDFFIEYIKERVTGLTPLMEKLFPKNLKGTTQEES